jgi:hypothetical protein
MGLLAISRFLSPFAQLINVNVITSTAATVETTAAAAFDASEESISN